MAGPGVALKAVPVTVLIATKNETANIRRCLDSLSPATRAVVVDSNSTDGTPEIARQLGVEVVQFSYAGGYPKKRQWALETLELATPWILLLDADEVVPADLWREIADVAGRPGEPDAYFITKGFHFLGRRFRFGGFSHEAILLFRRGCAAFEHLDAAESAGLDMEVHERIVVRGKVGRLRTPLIHEDFKGLQAYLDRHNRYSTWEAVVRRRFLRTGEFGDQAIRAQPFGNSQERRRWVKKILLRIPGEPWAWFFYHYVMRLGFLEGREGFIASQIRAHYIADVRAKVFEHLAAENRAITSLPDRPRPKR